MEIFYFTCPRTGKREGGEFHSCVEGSRWLSCEDRWQILGERWSERYVVSAAGMPLEKWRRIDRFEIPDVRPASVQWELVWKSPFSNSLSRFYPKAPKHGGIKGGVSENKKPGAVQCAVDSDGIWFTKDCERKIQNYFDS